MRYRIPPPHMVDDGYTDGDEFDLDSDPLDISSMP